MEFVDSYLVKLNESPISVKIVTGFVQMAVADFIAQQVDNRNKGRSFGSIDIQRWLIMCTWVVAIAVPVMHWYYNNILEVYFSKGGMEGLVMKVAVDQLIWSPIINCIFLYYSAVMNGKDMFRAFKHVQKNILSVYLTSLLIWPLCMFIQFSYFNVHEGMIFNLFVGFFWSIILCLLQNRSSQKSAITADAKTKAA